MSMGEEDIAGRITRRLDTGLSGIDQRVSARLRSARETALERLEAQPAWAWSPAGAATARTNHRGHNIRHFASIAALIAVVAGTMYWQRVQHAEKPVDIDAKLLSGDLPIDAYLDKGLDKWLTR
jgi:hypothetical protein